MSEVKPHDGGDSDSFNQHTALISYHITQHEANLSNSTAEQSKPGATAANTATQTVTEPATCAMQGCDRHCHHDLTRPFVVEAGDTGVPEVTERRLVCARHYYAELAVREAIWWLGFAIFLLLLAPTIVDMTPQVIP